MDFRERIIDDNIWCFEQAHARCFLFVGETVSLLVDSCLGGDLKALCESKAGTPVKLVLTHGDGDHIGCMRQFDESYMHPAEFSTMEARTGQKADSLPLWEGSVFDIGRFCFEVIHLPGHTPGSIALLERKRRFLLGGDTIQADPVYMFGTGRNLAALRLSLQKLQAMKGAFDRCYASHGELSVGPELIDEMYLLADELCRGAGPAALPAPEDGPPNKPPGAGLYVRGKARICI